MIETVLEGLLKANLAGGAAILAVLALRKAVRRAFGARVGYGLWAVVPLAAAASLAPRPQAETLISPIVLQAGAVAGRAVEPLLSAGGPSGLLALWLAGAAAAAGLLAVRQSRFLAEVAAGRGGPAVVGALRPRIVTPDDFEARFAADERGVILAHEAAHLEQGDARVNALAATLQCACWFNPLVHLAAHLLRIDQELACDATVIGRYPDARRTYAEALLKTQLAQQSLPLGCHWPAASEHPLKERILMLKSPLPAPARRVAGGAAVGLLCLSAGVAAWAAQAPEADPARAPIAQPDWIRRPEPADVARFYPPAAAEQHLTGGAVIACVVTAAGLLENCTVAREDPAGAGFGEAALKMSERFAMRPMTKHGRPVAGGRVRIPIRFVLPTP